MDRASDLFRQMEAAFIEVAWMWAEVQGILKTQETVMKKVGLELTIAAKMTDADGDVIAAFPGGGSYKHLDYPDAQRIIRSFSQAYGEHGERVLAMGDEKAAELIAAEAAELKKLAK